MKKETIFREDAKEYFDALAKEYPGWKERNSYYYSKLVGFYKKLVPEGKDVLEIGCRDGSLLHSLNPGKGTGIDVSEGMIAIARKKHPKLSFFLIENEKINLHEQFDYIIMSNVIGYVQDLQKLFKKIRKLLRQDANIIISSTSPLTEPLMRFGELFGLKTYEGLSNRFYVEDVINLLELNDYEVVDWGYELPVPRKIPILSDIVNRNVRNIRILEKFSFIQYIVAKPEEKLHKKQDFSCSIIVPCHNEADNIKSCIERIPDICSHVEIIAVDDGSTDSTADKVKELQKKNPQKNIKLISYFPKMGKGAAVRRGFDSARGEILLILDADMAVPPEELSNFYDPIAEGKADAINGTRMVYMMEKQAMPTLHLFGNKIFSLIFSWIMEQRITDTLCGTKAIRRKDYEKIKMGRCPWGDFDILVGIAKLGVKMVEMPVHYKAREAGKSKMRTFLHGFKLLGMCMYAFKELKLKKWFSSPTLRTLR